MLKNILTTLCFIMALSLAPTSAVSAASILELIEVEQQVQITIVDNVIHVSGANGQVMHIYNVAGVRVMSAKVDGIDKRFDYNLPKGCYIVKVGKTARKISIK